MGYFCTRACEYSLEVDGWPLSAISPCWDYTIIPFNNADRPVNGGEDGMDFSNRADKQFSLSIIPTTIQVVRYSMSILYSHLFSSCAEFYSDASTIYAHWI